MASRVTHIVRFSVQDYRTSRVRARSAVTGDYMLRLVYNEILFALYEMGGVLPSDPEDLADILLLPADEIARCLPILAAFGKKSRGGVVLRDDGTLVNTRVSENLEELRTFLDGQSRHGRRGGRIAGKGRPKKGAGDDRKGGPEGVQDRPRGGDQEALGEAPCGCGKAEENDPVFRSREQGSDRATPNQPKPKPKPKAKEPPPSGGGLRGRAVGARDGPEARGSASAAAAACRSMVEAVELAWSVARGAGAMPLSAEHRLALESLAARGAPAGVIAAKVAEVVGRQAVAGKPVTSFGYLLRGGALEEAFEAWAEGGRPEDRLDSSLLDGYRLMRIRELSGCLAGGGECRLGGRVVPRGAAERALERLRRAGSAGEVDAVLQALFRAGGEGEGEAVVPRGTPGPETPA